jgi:hypothetical protein
LSKARPDKQQGQKQKHPSAYVGGIGWLPYFHTKLSLNFEKKLSKNDRFGKQKMKV